MSGLVKFGKYRCCLFFFRNYILGHAQYYFCTGAFLYVPYSLLLISNKF